MEELETAINDTEGQIVAMAQSVEGALSTAFNEIVMGVINGNANIQESFSKMFASIAADFIAMATKMIAKALILKALGVLFPGAECRSQGRSKLSVAQQRVIQQAMPLLTVSDQRWVMRLAAPSITGSLVAAARAHRTCFLMAHPRPLLRLTLFLLRFSRLLSRCWHLAVNRMCLVPSLPLAKASSLAAR